VDPHHLDADPDSTYHPDADHADPDADPDSGCLFDADPDFYSMRIWMRIRIWIRFFILFGDSNLDFFFYPDPGGSR
jgi:hypothetical protein